MDVKYQIEDTILGVNVKEKDSRVTINADMKVSEQCDIADSKGNQILGLMRRDITYKEKSSLYLCVKQQLGFILVRYTSLETILQEGYRYA